jgi:hypothetical protein
MILEPFGYQHGAQDFSPYFYEAEAPKVPVDEKLILL